MKSADIVIPALQKYVESIMKTHKNLSGVSGAEDYHSSTRPSGVQSRARPSVHFVGVQRVPKALLETSFTMTHTLLTL